MSGPLKTAWSRQLSKSAGLYIFKVSDKIPANKCQNLLTRWQSFTFKVGSSTVATYWSPKLVFIPIKKITLLSYMYLQIDWAPNSYFVTPLKKRLNWTPGTGKWDFSGRDLVLTLLT